MGSGTCTRTYFFTCLYTEETVHAHAPVLHLSSITSVGAEYPNIHSLNGIQHMHSEASRKLTHSLWQNAYLLLSSRWALGCCRRRAGRLWPNVSSLFRARIGRALPASATSLWLLFFQSVRLSELLMFPFFSSLSTVLHSLPLCASLPSHSLPLPVAFFPSLYLSRLVPLPPRICSTLSDSRPVPLPLWWHERLLQFATSRRFFSLQKAPSPASSPPPSPDHGWTSPRGKACRPGPTWQRWSVLTWGTAAHRDWNNVWQLFWGPRGLRYSQENGSFEGYPNDAKTFSFSVSVLP